MSGALQKNDGAGGRGAGVSGYRNRLERGAAFSPLTLRSHALIEIQLGTVVRDCHSKKIALQHKVFGSSRCTSNLLYGETERRTVKQTDRQTNRTAVNNSAV